MKLLWLPTLLYLSSLVSTASIPPHQEVTAREPVAEHEHLDPREFSILEKRKGGGGGRGGGGGGRGSSSSSGGKGGSSGSSGGGRSPSSYSFSSTQNTGGRTILGSGLKPAYNGRYAGGAAIPYTSGQRSPTRGYLPIALPIAAFAFFPGLWLYGSLYAYPYHFPYYYSNNGRNEAANVTCLCQQYSECGCDDNGNSTFVQNLVNNGTGHPVNSSTVRFITYPNGTSAAYINGTLPNGTTAAGGTDPSNASEISGAARLAMQYVGYWVMAATGGATVLLL